MPGSVIPSNLLEMKRGNVIEGRSMAIDITERKTPSRKSSGCQKKWKPLLPWPAGLPINSTTPLSVMTGNIDLLRLGLIQEEGIGDCASQMMKIR